MSHVFAYCRVSTAKQTTDTKIHEIEAAGFNIESRRVITEIVSGSTPAMERKGFRKLVDRLDWEDVLIVTKLDRLGRNAMDVRETVERLAEMQVRDLLVERTQAGLARAKGKERNWVAQPV